MVKFHSLSHQWQEEVIVFTLGFILKKISVFSLNVFICFFLMLDENVEPQMSSETPPPRPPANTVPPVEAKQEVEAPVTLPPDSSAQSVLEAVAAPEVQSMVTKDVQFPPSAPAAVTAPPDETVSKPDTEVSDTVDARIGPSSSKTQNTEVKTEEPAIAEKDEEKEKPVEVEEEEQVASEKLDPAAEASSTLEPVKQVMGETATKVAPEVSQPPPSEAEPAEAQTQCPAPLAESESQADPLPAESAQCPLYNGLPQDTHEELTEGTTLPDTTPPSKPDTALSQEFPTAAKTAAVTGQELQNEEKTHEESDSAAPSTEDSTTMQGIPWLSLWILWVLFYYTILVILLYYIFVFSNIITPPPM